MRFTRGAPICLAAVMSAHVVLAAALAPDPKQLCPPCAAVASAQEGIEKIPAGALSDHGWALGPRGVNAPKVSQGTGSFPGKGATIVQIDTGVVRHPLLHPADDEGGVDFTAADELFGPGHRNLDPLLTGLLRFPGHGTKTSSVIIARPVTGYDVTGVARGARVIAVRATQGVMLFPNKIGELEADQHRIAHALNVAAQGANGLFKRRIDVVSMSLGGWPPVPSLCTAVENATNAGIIVIVAAGNEIKRTKYPARCPTAIAIAGSTFNETPWSGSAGSEEVVAAAPAEGVWTASVMAGAHCIEASTGTSFATALVAGIAAEWVVQRQRRGGLPPQHVEAFRAALSATTRPWKGNDAASWARKFGTGIVDVTRLMALGK